MDQLPNKTIPEGEKSTPEKKTNAVSTFMRDLMQTALLALVLYLAINAIVGRIRIESISMEPTLYESDLVLVNKVVYKFNAPMRGDVIVFHFPLEPDSEPYIKRVIGLPRDRIKVSEQQVFVNSDLIQESYIQSQPLYDGEWEVPDEALFVLGDNRNRSSDSHQWGMVPLENVIGRAEVVYFPFEHWQVLHQNVATAASD